MDDAEDLVQETVQFAWQHPPASGRSVRGWQVELAAPTDRADEFRILDATGRPMLLVVFRGTSRTQNFKSALVDGRSQVLTIGEGGVTAVFSKAGAEVGRLPLQLQLGQVNTIRF